MNSSTRSYVVLLAGASLWCALIVFPVFQVFNQPFLTSSAEVINKAFSAVCHQYDSRSFHIFGYRLAVCSRCTLIYAGFLAGVFLWRFVVRKKPMHPKTLWIIALLPMIIDVAADAFGLHTSDFLSRSITGGWFGIIAGRILTPYFIQACSELHIVFNHSRGNIYEPTVK